LAELVKWYSFAKVFINPTYMDTFPTTNIEAIACGTPVITYNSGGSPEATDANTGYVHQKGDILSFKESIVTVVESGKSKYIAECRDRAITHFDQNLQFLKYVNLYEELLSK
jgi:glycosyltransferase involved in cell wall biosynthesis